MSAPKVYGWCPGALRPMMSGDGLVVRVRPPMGRLTPAQAAGVAQISTRFGNGLIDLSSRANLQLRGLQDATHMPAIEELRALNLIDADIATETRRNLVIQPFWTDGDATAAVATALTKALAASDAPSLPGKFGFAVDCGPKPILQDISADIRIEMTAGGLICRPDGASTGIAVTLETAAETALTLARWFLDTGGAPEGRGRMAAHIARNGLPPDCNVPCQSGIAPPRPGMTGTGALVALEFGQIPAETLAALAKYGALRITPWRMLLVETATAMPDIPGLILDPDDPRLRVTACTGAPGCPQALSPTREIARSLASRVTHHLHVSGCAKGCAHPGPCARTIVATGRNKYDLIHDGRTTDTPARTGLTLNDLQGGVL